MKRGRGPTISNSYKLSQTSTVILITQIVNHEVLYAYLVQTLCSPSPESWSKICVILAWVATTVVSCTIIALSIRKTSTTRYCFADIQQNRAHIQFIVHILSTILGALQTYVASSLIRFRVNTRLSVKHASLDYLKLGGALNVGKWDFNLPPWSTVVLFIYLIAMQVPAAIWAAAITPVMVSKSSAAHYHVPFYNPSTIGNWGTTCRPAVDCGVNANSITTEQGTFTNIAWKCMVPHSLVNFKLMIAN